jgi:hypothetical protein
LEVPFQAGSTPVTSYTALAAPIAVQEIVLALWLILRGIQPAPLRYR